MFLYSGSRSECSLHARWSLGYSTKGFPAVPIAALADFAYNERLIEAVGPQTRSWA